MTSVRLPPRPLSYAPQSPTGGILLNPSPYRRTSTLPQPSYPSRSNQSLSSTSSSEHVNTPSSLNATPPVSLRNTRSLAYTSYENHVLHPRSGSAPEYGNSGSRRIRFAPLPDPRRAVLVTEHGEELPLPSVFDDDDPSIPRPNLRNFRNSPSSSLLLGDDVVTTKEVPTITSSSSGPRAQAVRPSVSSPSSPVQACVTESPTPSTATITSPTAFSSSSSSARFAKRLLFPFRIKTDGSCRPGSRDSSSSRDDSPPSWSIPLSHWASAPDEGSRSTSTNGDSLSRGRSAAATTQSKPKRMLNGRVYGARKHHRANLFDNIPDEEPEFVEWGYGGMGSVAAGGVWAKVQSDRKFFDGHGGERGRRGASDSGGDAEDDGSGMGWVKKRREERERKKREEQVAQEAASKTNAGSAPTVASAPVADTATAHTADSVSVDHDITTVTPAPPRPEDDDDSSDEGDEEVGDESSSTEQEDDADEVGLLIPFH